MDRLLGRMAAPLAIGALVLACMASIPEQVLATETQIGARGFAPERVYDVGDIDVVNLFNGGLTLTVPIGHSYPLSPSFSYGLTLVYNSNVWDLQSEIVGGEQEEVFYPVPNAISNAGLGWTLTLGMLFPPESGPGNDTLHWMYVGPDGQSHHFYDELHGNTGCGTCDDGSTETKYTRDNSFIRMRPVGTEGTTLELDFPNDTTHVFTNYGTSTTPAWLLDRIRDQHGNFLDINYQFPSPDWELVDSLGRRHWVRFATDPELGLIVTSVELAAFEDALGAADPSADYTFDYGLTPAQIPRCYRNTEDDEVPKTAILDLPLLNRVVYPDGSEYSFVDDLDEARYLPDCGPTGNLIAGALTGVRLRTRGQVEWDYGSYFMPSERGAQTTAGVRERRELDEAGATLGTWVYANETISVDPGTGELEPKDTRTHVTFPGDNTTHGHCSTHYFSAVPHLWTYGLPFSENEPKEGIYSLSVEVFTGSRLEGPLDKRVCDDALPNEPVRSTYVAYESDFHEITGPQRAGDPEPEQRVAVVAPPSDPSHTVASPEGVGDPMDAYNAHRRLAGTRTTYHDDAGHWVETENRSYDGFGHYRQTISESSFGSYRTQWVRFNNDRGTFPVITMIQFNEPWILNTYAERSLSGPTSPQSEQDFCFDQGRVIRTRTLEQGVGESPADLVTEYDYDIVNPALMIRERYYGGWQNGVLQEIVDEPADLCDLDISTLTPQYVIEHTYSHGVASSSHYVDAAGASVLRTTDLDIDPSTALVTAARDTLDLETTFEYDLLGRLEWQRPGNTDATRTKFIYANATTSDPATVIVREAPGSGPGVVSERRHEFDGLGRIVKESVLMPNGGATSYRTTQYTGRGWKDRVSEWTDGSKIRTTKFRNYDPFGRPTLIRPPDGNNHEITISHLGARQVDRTVQIAVGGTLTPVTTTEIYDSHGRLKSVTEPSGPGTQTNTTEYSYNTAGNLIEVHTDPGPGQQSRHWEYNGLGNLQFDDPAERTSSEYFYSEYDALRNPKNVRALFLDPYQNTAIGGLAMSYDRAGRVVEVREFHDSQRILKEFVYGTGPSGNGGPHGKLWKAIRHNYHPTSGADTVVEEEYSYGGVEGRISQRVTRVDGSDMFDQSFTWTEGGQIDVVGYPSCAPAGCSPPARNVDHDYDMGFLSAVIGYASTFLYESNQMISEIHHANGVHDLWVIDPNQMRRPKKIKTAGVTPFNFNTGDYAYDGAGNITAIGDDAFEYDRVSRLTSGTVRGGPSGDGGVQTLTYDVYGNILEMNTNGTVQEFDVNSNYNLFDDEWVIGEDLRVTDYDKAGNLILWAENSDGTFPTWYWSHKYLYDEFNMMIRHQRGVDPSDPPDHTTRFLYTADDERLARIEEGSTGTETHWTVRDLNGQVLRTFKEFPSSGTWMWTRDYVWREGKLLASVKENGGSELTEHYHLDHLGNPRMVTGAGKQSLRRHDFYPFGEEFEPGADPDTMRFTGHERDFAGMGGEDDAGDLDYMHSRYYGPGMGRFLSVDPIDSSQPSSAQSWNKYTYALNNPLRFVDPNGLEPLDAKLLQFFNAFFDADFARVDIQTGLLAQAITGIAGAEGVTLGENIYLSPEAARDYEKRNRSAIRLVGHELTHTLQYRHLGTQRFLSGYLQHYSFSRTSGDTPDQAYRNIILEDIAFRVGSVIGDFLRTNPEIQGRLESGQSLSQQYLQQIDSALADAAKSGKFKTGLQFIQGFLVYIEPPPE